MIIKYKNFFISGFILCVLSILLYLIFVPKKVKVDLVEVTRGNFEETLMLDGYLRSKEHYTVTAFADGDIKRIDLHIGDPVKKNEKIGELFWDNKYVPIKAPINGVIAKIFRESAGPIHRGESLVEIINPESLEAVVEVLTTDAVRLELGGELLIRNLPGIENYKSYISRISKAGFIKISSLGVEEERTEVISELKNIPSKILKKLGDNFHIEVSFIVNMYQDVLKLPIGAIFREGDSWAVYLLENGRARKKNIEIRVMNQSEAIINSGLKLGDIVVNYPGDLVKDGTRIE